MGPARYGDLNSDLPVCISIDTPHNVTCLHIQNGYRSTRWLIYPQGEPPCITGYYKLRFAKYSQSTKVIKIFLVYGRITGGHDNLNRRQLVLLLVREEPLIERSCIVHLKTHNLVSDLSLPEKRGCKEKDEKHTQSVKSPRIKGNPSKVRPNENSSEHAT